MKTTILTSALVALSIGGASVGLAASPEIYRELATPGTLRVAVAVGSSPSAFRVTRDRATGQPRGVPVTLAQDLAQKLGVAMELVPFESAMAMTNAAAAGAWDVAFVPADVKRAQVLDFTAPYYLYEAGFLARAGSKLRRVDQLDARGVRIGALAGSTTLLNTSRALRKASVVPFPTRAELHAALRAGKIDVVAMPLGWIREAATEIAGSRSLDGEFHVAGVAAAVPKNHPAMLAYLREFIEAEKASGAVQKALESEGILLGIVAPPAAKE
jgi:polar amino acid transport system substrate-binding protein